MMEELDSYLNIVIGKDAGILFLCVFGAVLNSVMLYMLLSKKQVRSSVHTVYMVQIALTDLLVCLVWLILTSVITHNLLQMRSGAEEYEHALEGTDDSNASSVYAAAVAEEETSPAQYRSWRIMYSWYNFHYYTNILLLASMSVERCAAVWKSMRCQRYQYNRKIIIGISVFMWIVAFFFVLPNLINPDLMVSDSDSPDSVSRTINPEDEVPSVSPDWHTKSNATLSQIFEGREPLNIVVDGKPRAGSLSAVQDPLARPYENESKNYKEDMNILFACYTIMQKAIRENDDYVTSQGRVTVHGCMEEILGITHEYRIRSETGNGERNDTREPYMEYSMGENPFDYGNYGETFDMLPYDDGKQPELSGIDYENDFNSGSFEIYNGTLLIGLDRHMYQVLLVDAVKSLMLHHQTFRAHRNEACDPDLSHPARIYVLVVNLVLGFFIPFSIIVFSYVSIAYMIGKRARSRMQPTPSETSTTHFAHNYIQNPSSTNAATGAIRLRDKQSRPRHDSVGRRMSDFMRNLVLRKPQDGAANRSYLTDSDREAATPFGSAQKINYSSASRPYEELSSAHAKSDNAIQYRPQPKTPEVEDSEEDPLYDPELQEAIRQLNNVRMRNNEVPRNKKYSSFYDAANDNIPQTIEEHPHEVEGGNEDERFLTASNGSYPTEATPPGLRNHTSVLLVRPNSRRESGGSYGSSMDSMATDQTSLMTSHHDKRHSGATTTSALTPPTPIEPSNPNSNQFFPSSDERMAHNRTQSAESGYPFLVDRRPQKPGSQLNDITLKLYSKSLQKKQFDDGEIDNLPKLREDDADSSENQAPGTSGNIFNPKDRYSYPRMTRSKSAPDDRLSSSRLSTRSTARLINETQRLSNGDDQETRQSISQKPKYNKQNSSSSTVYYTRGRTYSTTSRSSVGGGNTLRKTMARKNAERHLRVSRTVLAYVIVFSICWLPQRITYLLYVIEALMGASDAVCIKLISGVRLLSFISVLLNPAVYILTQRDFQTYVRNSVCVSRVRRWYVKCSKKSASRPESNIESRGRLASSDRNDVELQVRREPEERELSGNNRQANNCTAFSPPYRMQSPPRSNLHVRKSPNGIQHEMFAPPTGINLRRHDDTIDEMKEEEAAAEESLEKEVQRLAAEEEKRRQDDINKNFLESSEDDIISAKNTTGSGNKTTSSSSKSENFEEFWMRWLESGGAQLLSSPNGNLTSASTPTAAEPRFPDLEQLAKVNVPNGTNRPGVLQ